MDSRPAGGRISLLTSDITPAIGWLIGMVFAIIDALTTWYALTVLKMHEGNPVGTWAIDHLGLSRALALRIIIGAAGRVAGCWSARSCSGASWPSATRCRSPTSASPDAPRSHPGTESQRGWLL
jgi:hypothetical protein